MGFISPLTTPNIHPREYPIPRHAEHDGGADIQFHPALDNVYPSPGGEGGDHIVDHQEIGATWQKLPATFCLLGEHDPRD